MSDAPGFAGVERRWGPEVVSVVVAEEAALLRRQLVLVLEAHPRIEVVAEAVDVESLVEVVQFHRPTVVVIDGRLPPGGGEAAVDAVVLCHPVVRAIVISETQDSLTALAGSGVAEVPREAVMTGLAEAVVAVADDEASGPRPR
jgi:DNA-binding NarL/FixJ family response regulator